MDFLPNPQEKAEMKQIESIHKQMPELMEAGFASWLQDRYGPDVVYMLDEYIDIMENRGQ